MWMCDCVPGAASMAPNQRVRDDDARRALLLVHKQGIRCACCGARPEKARTHGGRPAAVPRAAASAERHRGAPAAACIECVHVAPAHARASGRPRIGLRAGAAGGRRQARGQRRARGGRAGRRGGGGGRRRRRRCQAGRRGTALAPALELLIVEERIVLAQPRLLLRARLIRHLASLCARAYSAPRLHLRPRLSGT